VETIRISHFARHRFQARISHTPGIFIRARRPPLNALSGIGATPERSGILMRELPGEVFSAASVFSVPCVACHDFPLAVSFPGVSE
jgi:hypothetical protein